MKKYVLLLLAIFSLALGTAQQTSIDGRLQPLLEDFFKQCDRYGIPYHAKLFQLKKIAVVENLKTSPTGMVLGMLQRNEKGVVENIAVNWVTTLDPEILKIVAFHEFGHYFLGYTTHVCEDCGIIMARVNSSYFDIANDWDNQLKILFENAPTYKKIQDAIVSNSFELEN